MFIRSDIRYKRRLDLHLNICHCESVWIEVDHSLIGIDNNIVFGTIYRSPHSPIPAFCEALDTILDILSKEKKSVIILGDININLLDASSSYLTQYVSCFQGYGLEFLLSLPTRCTNNGLGTLIDHALSNLLHPPSAFIHQSNITDHFPVALCFENSPRIYSVSFVKNKFDRDKFKEMVSNSDWSCDTLMNNAESAYTAFISVISNCVSSSTTCVQCHKRYSSPRNPWLTKGLLNSLRKKDNLYKKTKRQPFNVHLLDRYKQYCNTLNAVMKDAKKRYYENVIICTGSDMKKPWRLINSFLSKTINPPIANIHHEGSVISNPLDIANAFSDYFSSPIPVPSSTHDALDHCGHSFFLFPATPEEVKRTITGIKSSSEGIDNISANHVKMIADAIAAVLTYIVNLIFETGVFPRELKMSTVIPVFKKGDRCLISNYRPIFILPFFSKVI